MTSTLAYIPSPPQGVWELGPFPLRAYALCIIAGIIVALVLGDRRWEARGGERGVIYDIALWAVPFGLIGGRLYHVITDWQTYFGPDGAGLIAAFRIWEGGLGIWGAVALGGVGAWIACRRRGIPLPAFGDAIAPGIILAQAIGRLGNYFNQELYGRATTVPWGLEIYERVDASGARNDLIGVSTGRVIEIVHPTFLYELVWNLLVFAVLIWADRRFNLGHGRLFALYVAGYCLGRFWIELLRSDMATELAGIRVNSFTSMFVFIGAVVYLMAAPRGREDPATLRSDVDEEVEAAAVSPNDFEADAVEPGDTDEDDAATTALLKEAAAATGVGVAAKVAGDDDAKDEDVQSDTAEPVAEAEALAEDVESAPSEDIAEAVAFADAGEAADREPLTTAGVVEGEDAVAAEESAEEAHAAAVEGAEEAEAVAEEVAAEDRAQETPAEAPSVKPSRFLGRLFARASRSVKPEPAEAGKAADREPLTTAGAADGGPDEEMPEPVAEAEALAEDVESAPSEDIAEAVAFAEAGEAADEEPPVTVGSVEGEDAVAAEESAEEAHAAAVEGAAEAEALADEVAVADAGEPESQPEPVPEVEAGEAADREALTTARVVEGEDAVAAEESAEEAHEAAVEGAAEAEALADEVAVADAGEPESEPEPVAEVEAGEAADREPLTTAGVVEGEDAVAAEESAEEAHEAAVEGAEEAEALADEVAGDMAEPVAEVGAGDAGDREALTTAGAVEGEDAVAAEESAEEAHEAAVEGAAEAEALADEVAADDAAALEGEDAVAEGGLDEDLEAAVERADEAEAVAEEIAVADAEGQFADDEPVEDWDAEAVAGEVGAAEAEALEDSAVEQETAPDETAEPVVDDEELAASAQDAPGDDVADIDEGGETDASAYRIITTPEPVPTRRRWFRRRK
ncbi:prolipoprotein diacylglyceryl transferase [Mycolicibacterium monacense]|uniref:prolipoprotein diacylglyceryl transferase n=1 Tax=Mycolicibacterium monacense TaxID=85693 RepID=UPI0007EBF474|nr:prolipoprotein diacylglyceryl transferase [Mycolicibacterium monacense]OBF52513.1 prolipoprotein diacylglyceryl transferase [Mycolicibacterium monacense]